MRANTVRSCERSPSEIARTRRTAVLCVNEDVLAETPVDLFGGQRVGDYAAECGVDSFGDAFERVIGEEGDDERSRAHVTGRIVS